MESGTHVTQGAAMTSDDRRFKSAIYEQFARVGKAVSNPVRLELLDLLCQAPRTVEVLAKTASISVANASQHLQVLRSARLVSAEKSGLYVTYRIADRAVCDLYAAIRSLAEQQLAEVERISRDYLGDRESMEPVDRQGLLARARDGLVTVLDVRPSEEYRAGHIAGALSVPLEQLEHRLAELPREREVVAYCRGPYCVLAVRAVELLRAKGFTALRLEDGVREWSARGLPLSAGDEATDAQRGSS